MTKFITEIIGDCTLILGNCLEVMPTLGKVGAVITDIPYGTTQCSWDVTIPFDKMWPAINSVSSDDTPVVLFGTEPFSSMLRLSNFKNFKYDWIWDKPKGTGYLNAKKQPMRNHEIISVFYNKQCLYNPQMTKGHKRKVSVRGGAKSDVYGEDGGNIYDSTERYPRSILEYSSDTQNSSLHSTQKPVSLMWYLVETYTSEGDTVLDFTMGSGTTLVACAKLGRIGIGIEIYEKYFEIACKRVEEAYRQPDMFIEPPKKIMQGDLLNTE